VLAREAGRAAASFSISLAVDHLDPLAVLESSSNRGVALLRTAGAGFCRRGAEVVLEFTVCGQTVSRLRATISRGAGRHIAVDAR